MPRAWGPWRIHGRRLSVAADEPEAHQYRYWERRDILTNDREYIGGCSCKWQSPHIHFTKKLAKLCYDKHLVEIGDQLTLKGTKQ